MRIRSLDELKQFKNMSQHSRRQLKAALESQEQSKAPEKKTKESIYSGLDKSRAMDEKRREKRAQYCLLTEYDKDPDPAAVLLRAAIKRWGHAMQPPKPGRHNDVASELMLPGRQFRIDVALLKHRIAIEFDGWSNHFRREAAQRDHEKTIFLAKHGWLVLRVSKKLVNNALEEFLDDVDDVRTTRSNGKWTICYASKRSFYTKLVDWSALCERY